MHLSTVRAASATFQRERDRLEAERQFQPEKRAALLELLSQGMRLMEAAEEIEVSPSKFGVVLAPILPGALSYRPQSTAHGRLT